MKEHQCDDRSVQAGDLGVRDSSHEHGDETDDGVDHESGCVPQEAHG